MQKGIQDRKRSPKDSLKIRPCLLTECTNSQGLIPSCDRNVIGRKRMLDRNDSNNFIREGCEVRHEGYFSCRRPYQQCLSFLARQNMLSSVFPRLILIISHGQEAMPAEKILAGHIGYGHGSISVTHSHRRRPDPS